MAREEKLVVSKSDLGRRALGRSDYPVEPNFRPFPLEKVLGQYSYTIRGNKRSTIVTVAKQVKMVAKFLNFAKGSRFLIIGTEPGGLGYSNAQKIAFWLCQQAFDYRFPPDKEYLEGLDDNPIPHWYQVPTRIKDNWLPTVHDQRHERDSYKHYFPRSLIILDGIFAEPSRGQLANLQDIIHTYQQSRPRPLVLLVQGANPLEFGFTKLHIKADGYIQCIEPKLVRQI